MINFSTFNVLKEEEEEINMVYTIYLSHIKHTYLLYFKFDLIICLNLNSLSLTKINSG